MKPIPLPPTKFLLEALRYEPSTGKLYWRKRPLEHFSTLGQHRRWNNRYAGTEAFCTLDKVWGYLRGNIGKKAFLAHRVVWKMVRGTEPPAIIDHRDRDTTNNRDENLREASPTQNVINSKKSGICFDAKRGKWRARVTDGKTRVHLGWHETEAEALTARKLAAAKLYGEWAP